ncbi:MAG: OmpA family protein [Bacteroidales bacterium]|nr:OmpA family protein [Bacteroidales bacterium]
MKKQLILFSLILAMFTAFSQEQSAQTSQDTVKKERVKDSTICHHRVNLHFAGSGTNNIYAQTSEIDGIYALGFSFEIGYTYFFNRTVGLGIGIGVEDLSSKLKTNLTGVVPGLTYPQQPDHVYDLRYTTNDLIEKQNLWALYVPLTVQFEHKFNGGKNGIYAGVGVQGYFPLVGLSRLKKGELITRGYEEYLNVLYQNDMPQHGLSTYNFYGRNKIYNKNKQDLRCSVDFIADFGGIFEINNKVDFYVGVYASYGFLDLLPKAEYHHTYVNVDPTAEIENKIEYNGLLGSSYLENYNTENNLNLKTKFNLIQFGLKLGFHIKPCGKVNPTLKNRYYDEMIKHAGDPICGGENNNSNNNSSSKESESKIIERTEIIYIIPQYSNEDKDTKPTELMSPVFGKAENKDNDNLKDIVDILSVTKILFDLDKDDPKVAKRDEKNIDKIAEIMKNDPNLVLIVEGYTCPKGSKEHNRALAKRRANNTRDYFISKGVPADQIETYSYIADDDASVQNINSKVDEEHRAAIFRIRRKN